jgi:hypothetical protein
MELHIFSILEIYSNSYKMNDAPYYLLYQQLKMV